LPFRGENIPAVLRAVAEDAPTALGIRASNAERPPSHIESVPRDLAVITFRALQKDPSRRYVTAQEFADDLRRWLAGEPIHARPVALAERAWLWAKRKPALAGALALLAITLIGSTFLLVRSNDDLRAIDLQRRGQIHRALLEKADAERQSMTPGRRTRALALVREALSFGPSVQARSVAASALAVSDVRVTQSWPVGRLGPGDSPMLFTPDLAHHVALVPAEQVRDPAWKEGALGLWRTADHALLKQIPISLRKGFGLQSLSTELRWVCVSMGQQLEVWDLQAEKQLGTFKSSGPPSAKFHPTDGTLIAEVAGELLRIHLPDLRQERVASGLTPTAQLSISPDGALAAYSQRLDLDGATPLMRLEVRSLADGARVYSSPLHLWGNMDWLSDNRSLVVFDRSTRTMSLHTISADEQRPPRELVRSSSTGRRTAVWPDDRTLGWADNSGFIHLHDLWLAKDNLIIPAAAISLVPGTDGTRFAYTPDSSTTALGELLPAPVLNQRKASSKERSVDRELALSPDGRWIATCDLHDVTLWRAQDMKPVAQRESSALENLHFSADSRQLRFDSRSNRRTVWDIRESADGKVRLEGTGTEGRRSPHLLSAASLNGHWEATTQPDKKASHYHLWREGKIVTTMKRDYNPHRVDWTSRLLSPDGRWAAYGCMATESAPVPGFTYVVHFDADNHRTMLSEKASHVHLAISPDSRWLVGGEGTDYVIWDSTDWRKVHQVPERLSDSVPGSAAFSLDGRLLALEVEHGKIRLLRPGTWEEILTISPPQNLPLVRMAFSPDSKHLFTTGGQILHRWDIEKLYSELTAMGIGW
jgi:WD40 repeat protein